MEIKLTVTRENGVLNLEEVLSQLETLGYDVEPLISFLEQK